MQIDDGRIKEAVSNTKILRLPRQTLATFGTTVINYYLLTEPIYSEIVRGDETVIREGRVSSERPRVVTPYYLTRLEGFGESAKRYLDMVIQQYGMHMPGLYYNYKNEHKDLLIVSDKMEVVIGRLNEKIDKDKDNLAAIIKGVDELWDVSLLKFISEMTQGSLRSNVTEMNSMGLLGVDATGVPTEARYRIEMMFMDVARGDREPYELKDELDKWGIYPQYEDRFLAMFRR
ncbi:MAG: hypothetical protein WC455_01555 [Dehalococcoidia bacterium]|jgi:hypothetical protein